MEPHGHSRSITEKSTAETTGSQMGGTSTNNEHGTHREIPQFQQLIPAEHVQLPTNASFGMGHHFVTPFPGYMHAVPPGLFSLNMMEDHGEGQTKRRRRTNYRDPENAAKLTTALGILIKQKEENKPQDLKSIATHFGLPYNTLRDNYLKVTTGKLLKDKSEKRPMRAPDEEEEGEGEQPKQKKSGTNSAGSSRTSTPREVSHSASIGSSAHPQVAHGVSAVASAGNQVQQQQQQQFAQYPMYHPQMHYMQQVQQMQQMHNFNGGMQHMQMPGAGMPGAGGMHHPMMHIFTAAPVGYQINPTTGRPFPVYAAPNNDMQAHMQAQMQAQQNQQNQQGGSTAVTPTSSVATPTAATGIGTVDHPANAPLPVGSATNSAVPIAASSSAVAMPQHTMSVMSTVPQMQAMQAIPAMPGMYGLPPGGAAPGMYAPMYSPHMVDANTGGMMPAGFAPSFPLMMPPPMYMSSSGGGAPTPLGGNTPVNNNASYLAAAMSAAYAPGSGSGTSTASNGNTSGNGGCDDNQQQHHQQQQASSSSSSAGQAAEDGTGTGEDIEGGGGVPSDGISASEEDGKSASDNAAEGSSKESAASSASAVVSQQQPAKEQGVGHKRDRS